MKSSFMEKINHICKVYCWLSLVFSIPKKLTSSLTRKWRIDQDLLLFFCLYDMSCKVYVTSFGWMFLAQCGYQPNVFPIVLSNGFHIYICKKIDLKQSVHRNLKQRICPVIGQPCLVIVNCIQNVDAKNQMCSSMSTHSMVDCYQGLYNG